MSSINLVHPYHRKNNMALSMRRIASTEARHYDENGIRILPEYTPPKDSP